jgi:hypothetical protein
LCVIVACGGESPVAEGGAGDTSTDAAVDTASDDATADAADDAVADVPDDVPEDSEQDVDEDAGTETDTETDAPEDAGDAGDVSSDATVDAPDTDRPRIQLADFLPCEDSQDCTNGAGNCITELSFSRETAGTPATISIAELDPDWPASGVCSRDCGTSPAVCAELSLSGYVPNIETPYTCMLVALGEAPYPEMDGLPDPASLDPEEQELGVPFAALCVPPLHEMEAWPVDFGQPCTNASPCSEGSACWLDAPFAEEVGDDATGACLATCGADDTCPVGFACEEVSDAVGATVGDVSGRFCLPLERTFSGCRDADADGFGAGQCDGELSTSHDCDDTNPVAWFDEANMDHGFTEWCGEALDVNCNGVPDVDDQVGRPDTGEVHCTACDDPCAGVIEGGNGSRLCGVDATGPRCAALCDEGWVDCDGVLDNGCEVPVLDTTRLFYPDCDDDGIPRAYEARFDCDGGGVTFEIGGETCVGVNAVAFDGEVRFDCHDNEARRAPGLEEVCDNLDNDCSATDDSDGIDDLARLAEADLSCAADALGTCAAGTLACRPDESEALVCVAGAPTPEVCDGLDNDCDGEEDNTSVNDEGAEVPVESRPDAAGLIGATGETCTAPDDSERLGICREGVLACDSAARELSCVYNRSTEEVGFFESNWAAGIVAPFSTSEPSWFVETGFVTTVRSAPIGDNESSTLTLTLDLEVDSRLEAAYAVSSEAGYDWLIISVDGEEQARYSGSETGTFTADLEAGFRVVTFTYEKDGSQSLLGDFALIPRVTVEPLEWLDWPGDGLDTNCDGLDGRVESAIFVLSGPGSDSNPGTRDEPLATMGAALQLAESRDERVTQILVSGNHVVQRQAVLSGVYGIFGGYDARFEAQTGRSNLTFAPTFCDGCLRSADYTAAVLVNNATDIRLDRTTITVGDVVASEGPVAALACEFDCDRLQLTYVSLDAGSGQPGAMGRTSTQAGRSGLAGWVPPSDQYRVSPSSPVLVCEYDDRSSVTLRGGAGGDPGSVTARQASGSDRIWPALYGASDGSDGDGGTGALNGRGGNRSYTSGFLVNYCQQTGRFLGPWVGYAGGVYIQELLPSPLCTTLNTNPLLHAVGGPGSNAVQRPATSAALNPVERPWDAADGPDGLWGPTGGSGGGGGGSPSFHVYDSFRDPGYCCCSDCIYEYWSAGSYGSSGATGGCGGSGGGGGGAGGTRIGLAVRGSEFPVVDGVVVNAGSGGAGGNGGSGQLGGDGGSSDYLTDESPINTRWNGAEQPYIYEPDGEIDSDGPSLSFLDTLRGPAGQGGYGGGGAGGAGGSGGAGGWFIGVLTWGATIPSGVDSGIEVREPATSAPGGMGGAGGLGGRAGNEGDQVPQSGAGQNGPAGQSCESYNALTRTGVGCIGG